MAENEELLVEDELDESDETDEPVIDLNNGLTEVQNRTLLALLSTKTHRAAAKKAGVARSTLYNWLGEPKFRGQWLELRTRRFSSAISRLQNMADDSVEALSKMIAAEKTPAASRVSAIRLNLDFACRGIELENLDLRVAALEEYEKANNHSSRRN